MLPTGGQGRWGGEEPCCCCCLLLTPTHTTPYTHHSSVLSTDYKILSCVCQWCYNQGTISVGRGRWGEVRCPPMLVMMWHHWCWCHHQPIRGAWCVGAVIGVEQNGAGCPEEENVFTEHLENGRRANSSKWPIDILYGWYAPIIIHDLQNAATHQK